MNQKFFIFVFFIFLSLFLGCSEYSKNKIIVSQDGVIDFRGYDFSKSVDLNGEWKFYYNKLLQPEDFEKNDLKEDFLIKVPGSWDKYYINGKKLSNFGYGTYKINLITDLTDDLFGLKLQDVGTSYKIWINGKNLGGSGEVATSRKTMKPKLKPQVYSFSSRGDNEIVVQVSNYYDRIAGMWYSVKLGTEKQIIKERTASAGYELFIFGSLLIMFLYYFSYFLLKKNDKSPLFFSLFCLFIGLRIIFTGEKFLIYSLFNFPYEFFTKIEYFTFYITAPLFLAFIFSLYPKEINLIFFKIFLIFSGVLSLFVLITPIFMYTYTLVFFQSAIILSGLYVMFSLFLALKRKREGSLIFLVGIFIIMITVTNDILYSNQLIKSKYLTSFGIFIFIFLQSLILSKISAKAFIQVETLSNNLLSLNERYDKFVPKKALKILDKNIMQLCLGDHLQKEMTILFSDLRDFTALSETMTPEQNFRFINAYLGRVSPVIRDNNGFIDKYIGDAIMAVFPDKVENAIDCAISMLAKIKIYNIHRNKSGYKPISMGIGIHTGNIMLGIIGEEERMEGTVISDAVN
ncbi:MAG TPA: 7TM diverse intracellular signaling domain-containing protein, partial [Spirochaetota bacterium]|nr:7TM diverse intracellular signaling domain-containing protein [Spirochaetota bacterium]